MVGTSNQLYIKDSYTETKLSKKESNKLNEKQTPLKLVLVITII